MANPRFSGNVVHAERGFLYDLPQNYDMTYVAIRDDFTGIAVDSTNDWEVVKDTGAAVAISADTALGELTLTSAATTDDDGASIQGNEIFLPASGRTIWFECKAKCSDATESDLMFGFTVAFATNPEAALTAANRICFQKNDGGDSVLCKTESGGTETSTDSGVDIVDATYVKLGIKVEGTGKVQFFIDGNLVATHTTNIPTTEMALAAFSLSGSATGTLVTTLDYIMGVQTR